MFSVLQKEWNTGWRLQAMLVESESSAAGPVFHICFVLRTWNPLELELS
jgi:hypothetical protein